MTRRSLQTVAVVLAMLVLAAAVLAALVWTRAIPLGAPHEIFGRGEYQRLAMPDAPADARPPAPRPGLDADSATATGFGEDAGADTSDSSSVSFAERFGDVGMEVSDPSWTDLTFDITSIGAAAANRTVIVKEVVLDGRASGSLQVHAGPAGTALVDPADVLALLEGSSVDTARLQALAGSNRVTFGAIRSAGIDLRYRPAQDQIAIRQADAG